MLHMPYRSYQNRLLTTLEYPFLSDGKYIKRDTHTTSLSKEENDTILVSQVP